MAPVGLTYKSNCTYPPLRLYRKLVRKARLPVVIPIYKQARIHLEQYIEDQFGLAPGCEIDPYDLPPRPTFEELFTKKPKPDNRSKPVEDFLNQFYEEYFICLVRQSTLLAQKDPGILHLVAERKRREAAERQGPD